MPSHVFTATPFLALPKHSCKTNQSRSLFSCKRLIEDAQDNLMRVMKVQTGGGVFTCPINQILLLSRLTRLDKLWNKISREFQGTRNTEWQQNIDNFRNYFDSELLFLYDLLKH